MRKKHLFASAYPSDFFPVKFALFSLKFKWFWKNYWNKCFFFTSIEVVLEPDSLQLKWKKSAYLEARIFQYFFWRKTRLFYVLRKRVKISALNLLFFHFNWSGSGARGYFNRSGKKASLKQLFLPASNARKIRAFYAKKLLKNTRFQIRASYLKWKWVLRHFYLVKSLLGSKQGL